MIRAGQIFVIGDSHIGLAEGSEVPILAWLERFAQLQPRALYLNGDLFHYLIAHPKFYTPSVEKVFAGFRELRDRGVTVHYVEGNRDFFIKGSFAEENVTDVALEYVIPAGERKYLVAHGDMINDHDYAYRFWRFASKNALSRFGVNLVPRGIARKFVDSVEKRLARSNFRHKSRLPIEHMREFGQRRGEEGVTHVVFGHFHEKLVLEGPPTVTVLPPWYENGEAMAIDPETGEFDWVVV
jgi:UDP-2,3-diacylglucosamine pyrophosphatase LpxH